MRLFGQKAQKSQKRNQAKVQNSISEQNIKKFA